MSSEALTQPAAAAPEPRRRAHLSDRTRAERKLAMYLVAPAVIVMLAVTAFPIVDTIILSLQRSSLDQPGRSAFIGLDNYGYVFKAHLFWMDLIHTVVITVISVSIEFVLGMLLALAMHRVIFLRGLLRSIALVPYAIVAVVAPTRGSTRGHWTTAGGSLGCSDSPATPSAISSAPTSRSS
jgi:multiple sugar transport system permease protein